MLLAAAHVHQAKHVGLRTDEPSRLDRQNRASDFYNIYMVNITPASTPVSEAVVASVAQAREDLRRKHGVRIVESDEVGEGLKYLKSGVYGFTYSPNTLDSGLFPKYSYLNYEIHKLGDASLHIFAVMTPEMKQKIETVTELAEIEFYPEPYNKATEAMMIPFAKLRHPKQPNREDGNKVKSFFQPA